MNWLEALILGIIQGLTEFLPVSSSGHIELGKAILGVDLESDNLLFSIIVHGATALSTIVVFRKTILELLKSLFSFQWNNDTKYITYILVSMIPVGVVGVLFEDEIEAFFDGRILFVGAMLLITSFLLWLSTRVGNPTGKVNYKNAIIVGVSQALAILPGISRSGTTISASLLLGISREEAAKFSFLMVLPPILGATLLKAMSFLKAEEAIASTGQGVSTLSLTIGFAAAFIAGVFACKLMIQIVKNSKLIYFAAYCLIVGLLAIGWSLFN